MEKSDCVHEDKQYPSGSELCIETQCMQCDNGEWGLSEFDEIGYGY